MTPADPARSRYLALAALRILAALMIVSGALGDRYGRRRVFLIGLVAFAAASLLCAAAWSIDSLIVARALQGIAGSLVIPNSLAVLRASFPPSERGRMIGAWTAWSGIATVVGPLLGGWLVDTASWRLIFAINLLLLLVERVGDGLSL